MTEFLFLSVFGLHLVLRVLITRIFIPFHTCSLLLHFEAEEKFSDADHQFRQRGVQWNLGHFLWRLIKEISTVTFRDIKIWDIFFPNSTSRSDKQWKSLRSMFILQRQRFCKAIFLTSQGIHLPYAKLWLVHTDSHGRVVCSWRLASVYGGWLASQPLGESPILSAPRYRRGKPVSR